LAVLSVRSPGCWFRPGSCLRMMRMTGENDWGGSCFCAIYTEVQFNGLNPVANKSGLSKYMLRLLFGGLCTYGSKRLSWRLRHQYEVTIVQVVTDELVLKAVDSVC
jgi:hypothetical protein